MFILPTLASRTLLFDLSFTKSIRQVTRQDKSTSQSGSPLPLVAIDQRKVCLPARVLAFALALGNETFMLTEAIPPVKTYPKMPPVFIRLELVASILSIRWLFWPVCKR